MAVAAPVAPTDAPIETSSFLSSKDIPGTEFRAAIVDQVTSILDAPYAQEGDLSFSTTAWLLPILLARGGRLHLLLSQPRTLTIVRWGERPGVTVLDPHRGVAALGLLRVCKSAPPIEDVERFLGAIDTTFQVQSAVDEELVKQHAGRMVESVRFVTLVRPEESDVDAKPFLTTVEAYGRLVRANYKSVVNQWLIQHLKNGSKAPPPAPATAPKALAGVVANLSAVAPAKAAATTPAQPPLALAKAPAKAPAKVPPKAPAKAPAKVSALTKKPSKAPAESPTKAPPKTPPKASAAPAAPAVPAVPAVPAASVRTVDSNPAELDASLKSNLNACVERVAPAASEAVSAMARSRHGRAVLSPPIKPPTPPKKPQAPAVVSAAAPPASTAAPAPTNTLVMTPPREPVPKLTNISKSPMDEDDDDDDEEEEGEEEDEDESGSEDEDGREGVQSLTQAAPKRKTRNAPDSASSDDEEEEEDEDEEEERSSKRVRFQPDDRDHRDDQRNRATRPPPAQSRRSVLLERFRTLTNSNPDIPTLVALMKAFQIYVTAGTVDTAEKLVGTFIDHLTALTSLTTTTPTDNKAAAALSIVGRLFSDVQPSLEAMQEELAAQQALVTKLSNRSTQAAIELTSIIRQ